MAEIPCVSVVIMQSTTVKTRAENSELLLKNFTIPGKSVAMPADFDRPLQAAIVHPADDLKVSFERSAFGSRRSIRVTVTTSTGARIFHHSYELTPVSLRAAGLLAVNFCAPFDTELFKLRVKSLAVGADVGVSEAAVLWVTFGHIFCKS
jgi:hypothetical protein